MVIGDWLFSPQVTLSGLYNDNIFSQRNNKTPGFGTSFGASGFASRDDGMSRSSLYFKGQADIYPDQSNGNSFTGAVGGSHRREFGLDVVFDGSLEIARLQNSLRSQGISPAGVLSLNDSDYTQFQGAASVRRNFNRFYLEGGASGTTQVYDESSATTTDKNGWSAVVRGRAGYDVNPTLSVYAEPSVNFQRYDSSFYETNVYKGVVGVSFPRLGLFTGDVYAGYMWANYPNAIRKWEQAPTIGGSVSWLPTPDITVTLAASQSFGINGAQQQNTGFLAVNSIAGAVSPTDAIASSTVATNLSNQIIAATQVNQQLFASSGAQAKTSTVSLGGRYVINALTNGGVTFTYQTTSRDGTAVTTSPTSDVFMARLSLDYAVWANWGIAGTYTFARVLYDQPGLSYSQNVVTVGVSGRL